MHLRLTLIPIVLALSGCAVVPAARGTRPTNGAAYLATASGRTIGTVHLAEELAAAEVVLFGEAHDDVKAHRAQLELLRELRRRGRPVVLALEMFERDVQPVVDAYLAEEVSEPELLSGGRAWPNYTAAYRPLVELAREARWPVIASNVPRPIAAAVAAQGMDALDSLASGAAAHRPPRSAMDCPRDAYFERFAAAMGGHPGGGGNAAAGPPSDLIQRIYLAQCVKDETMAESIVRALIGSPGALVVHVNGGFHSDYRLGIAPRVERRRPRTRVVVISSGGEEDAPAAIEAVPAGDFILVR